MDLGFLKEHPDYNKRTCNGKFDLQLVSLVGVVDEEGRFLYDAGFGPISIPRAEETSPLLRACYNELNTVIRVYCRANDLDVRHYVSHELSGIARDWKAQLGHEVVIVENKMGYKQLGNKEDKKSWTRFWEAIVRQA